MLPGQGVRTVVPAPARPLRGAVSLRPTPSRSVRVTSCCWTGGDSWNQQLTLHGSGSSSSYATLGAYGTGNRPVITRNSQTTDLAVDAEDPSYWNYRDLELANAGAGLRVYYDRLSNNGLNFSDIYAHNMGGFTDSTSNLQCQSTNRVFLPAGIDITGDLPTFSSTDLRAAGRHLHRHRRHAQRRHRVAGLLQRRSLPRRPEGPGSTPGHRSPVMAGTGTP